MKDHKIDIAIILCYIILLLPFVATIVFSVPNTDDFSVANRVMQFSNPLKGALYHTYDFYMNWSGSYVTAFLQFLLNPLLYFSTDSFAIGFFLLFSFLLFVVVVFLYFSAICRVFFGIHNKYTISVIVLLFLILFLNSGLYQEIYYWYVGNSYLWVYIISLINQVMIMMYFQRDKSTILSISLCAVGFIACVGYTQAVFSGVVYLAAWACFSCDRKDRILRLIPLVFMIIGGCTSVFAPGNYVRHSKITSSGISIKTALLSSIQNTIDGIMGIIIMPITIPIVILLIFIGYKYIQISKVNLVALFIMQFVSVMGTTFPVALGYSNHFLPNRIHFLINLTNCIYVAALSLSVGNILANSEIGKRVITDKTAVTIFIGTFFSIFVLCYQINSEGKTVVEKFPWTITIENIESVAYESDYYKDILNGFLSSDGKEVILRDFPYHSQTGIIKPLDITDDPDDWRNRGIAKFFNLTSVFAIKPE